MGFYIDKPMRFSKSPFRHVSNYFLSISFVLMLVSCGGSGSSSGSGSGASSDTGNISTAAADPSGSMETVLSASRKRNTAIVSTKDGSSGTTTGGTTTGGTTTASGTSSPGSACSFPAWQAGKTYTAGSIVTYTNGTHYKASHDNPGYDPTISTWYWDPYPCSTASGSTSPPSGAVAGNFIVSEAQFNQMFPSRNSFYTYSGLVTAMSAYPEVFNSGSDTVKKQEAAAFLANVNHETGGLQYIREINQANWPLYCQTSAQYPCAAGQQYYGRGPIQLSWNYNYGAAGAALGLNLLADPDMVARDAAVAWKTAIWYWMTQRGGASMTPHNAMINGYGFAETIRAINGGLECGQPAGSIGNQQMQYRVSYYSNFTRILGVSAGSNLSC